MKITRTRHGLRLSQHGVVISELRVTPGPTHSVFDLLAAIIDWRLQPGPEGRPPSDRVALLGFAGGGMLAPLRAMGVTSVIETCDLDRDAYELFRRHCAAWSEQVRWQHRDALAWLRRQRAGFDLLVEDLSIPAEGDVTKPAICWASGGLPELIRTRLRPGGWAVFNLLPPLPVRRWRIDVQRLAQLFPDARLIEPDEFENRILLVGEALPSARELGRRLRQRLRGMRSRQADRFRVTQGQPNHHDIHA